MAEPTDRAAAPRDAPARWLTEGPASARARGLLVCALILLPQVVLFLPSLVGARVLLPLDALQAPGVYLPVEPGAQPYRPLDPVMSDLVFELEHERRYAVEAVRSLRIPLWNPLNYCGTPFVAANHTSVFYPLRLLDYLFPGPGVIAWGQLAKAWLAGVGAYLCLRRVLGVLPLAAAFGAALWPNVGFLVLWAGFTISQVGAHLPWMLLAADGTLRRPRSAWPVGLACATAVLLVSGHAAVAVHVLLGTGLFALFRLGSLVAARDAAPPRVGAACLALAFGVGAGVLLSGPQTLPTLEYMRESWRIQQRQAGHVETPPVGLPALPAVAMPFVLGSSQRGSLITHGGNRLEGPQAAYAGLLSLCVLAPLAFLRRRGRGLQWFWVGLGLLGLAQVLGIPGLVAVFRLPGLDTLRNNRLTLFSAWSIVALATVGLDVLLRREFAWRAWCWLPLLLCAAAAGACLLLAQTPPEVVGLAERALVEGGPAWAPPLDTSAGIQGVALWFERMFTGYALLAAVALLAWLALRRRTAAAPWFAPALGLLALAEVVQQGHGVNLQCDPALYFPRTPVLSHLATLGPGRLVGDQGALPAVLNQTHGLQDIRGYDATDPARYVQLLELFRDERSPPAFDYAALQGFMPRLPSPLADLLGLRFLLRFGAAGPSAVFASGGWSIEERPTALPRAHLPARAERVEDSSRRLELLGRSDFDPRQVVYLESEEPLPVDTAPARGTARFVRDEPEQLELALDIQAGGWLVLADRWAPGWRARVDGVERPVLVADHALRAVRVEPGERRLVFTYEPASWRAGLLCAAAGLLCVLGWLGFGRGRAGVAAEQQPPPR